MDKKAALTTLIRDANKLAKFHCHSVKLVEGVTVVTVAKNLGGRTGSFDVRIEEMRDPVGKQLMSVKKQGEEERYRVYATADGRILFGILTVSQNRT